MTDEEKQAWRDLLEDYLNPPEAQSYPYAPRVLIVGNRCGTRVAVAPMFEEDETP